VVEAVPLHITNCATGNFTGACGSGPNFDDPEPGWTATFTCDASPSATGWCNTQFDKDVATNRQTLDPNQRIAAIKDAQKVFYNDVPFLYLERRYSWMFSTPNVQNFKYANDGIPLVYQMWLKTRG
jgi:ABC-type transport system substrate-binding protein